jgi:ribonucleoside-diphosphate reductase alpha chain
MAFRNKIGSDVFNHKYKYREGGCGTWEELSETLVERICNKYMTKIDMKTLKKYIKDMKFIPGGRYIYYAGRKALFINNCFTMIAEDSREGWADLGHKHFMALMCGGGVGTYYGKIRPKGCSISKTGGESSGTVPLMMSMNEIGRNVRQGGSRRSALWAGLPWDHGDINEFLYIKDWSEDVVKLKEKYFDHPAPLDVTNISVCYNTRWYEGDDDEVFNKNVLQACKTSEPGFAFNLYENECDVARNACTEVTSMFDGDVCNLGSVNMSRINSIDEFEDVCRLANMFLICGTLVAELPYEKVSLVREMSRKIGLGLTGVHEWLIKRNYKYEFNDELHKWMEAYKNSSIHADNFINILGITPLVKYRAVAPAGTLSILAGTSSGIEPIYAKGTKRKYLKGEEWVEETYVDPTVKFIIENNNIDHRDIETSMDLSKDVERRIKFQADMQDYVDMGISSTINLPAWDTEYNNENTVKDISLLIRKYAKRLRGLTFYADGSRGGQPLEQVPYEEAVKKETTNNKDQIIFMEETSCKGGSCGI